jgi:hypothetical protein
MELSQHIEIRPYVMFGKPCLKGTRIPVYLVLEKLGAGETAEQILAALPTTYKRPHHRGAPIRRSFGEQRDNSRFVKLLLTKIYLRGKRLSYGIKATTPSP